MGIIAIKHSDHKAINMGIMITHNQPWILTKHWGLFENRGHRNYGNSNGEYDYHGTMLLEQWCLDGPFSSTVS